MRDKLIALLKGSAVLTLSNICIKAINFFLLPLYTKFLQPEQLGVSDTITTFVGLVYPILVLGLDAGFSAFYFDKDTREHKSNVFSSVFFILCLTSIIPIVGIFFSKGLSMLLFGTSAYSWIIIIALLAMCCNLWYLPFSVYLRAENKMTSFAIVNFTASALMIASNIVTVSILEWGEAALIVSSLLANSCMLILYVAFSRKIPKGHEFSGDLSKKLLKYSIPLVPMVVSTWILTTSDRLILLEYMGEASVGLYGISSRFVNVINVFTNSIYMAYTTFAFSSKDEENSNKVFATILDVMNLGLSIVVFLVSIFSIEILNIMVDEQYYSSYIVLPGLLFAQLFYAANTIVNYGLSFEKKSGKMLLSVTVAAAANLILNIILIPRYGLLAAAMTTWFGYGIMLLLTNHFSQKVYTCPYKVKKLTILNACILLITMISLEYVSFEVRIIIAVTVIGIFSYLYKDTIKILVKGIKTMIGRKNA